MDPALPRLESTGLAVPGEGFLQSDVRAVAEELLSGLAPELVAKMDVFSTVGIRKRHFVRPLAWYLEPHGWEERSAVYAEEGVRLLAGAAREALARADLHPSEVDGVVLVSTTGLATPSLDARLLHVLGLRPDVQRVPVWGLGCAGGVAGLSLAADLARAAPERRYLLLAVELCSLAFNLSDLSMRAFVASCLFSDGACAAVVAGARAPRSGRGPAIRAGARHTWPDTGRVMGWDVLDGGLRVVFSRSIPQLVEERFSPVVEGFLKAEGCAPDRLVFHPGGTKVLDAYAKALGRPSSAFSTARETLREYGNMSSPTVFFVLDRMLQAPLRPGETALLAALGPGFSAELALLEG